MTALPAASGSAPELAQARLSWLEARVAAHPGEVLALNPGEVVSDPARHLRALAQDLALGAASPRVQTGALDQDLERLIDQTLGRDLSQAIAGARTPAELRQVGERIREQALLLGGTVTARLREEYRTAPARQPLDRGLGG
jgi:hypothetical protein